MLLVKMTIYNGCEWSHTTDTRQFKDKEELNDFLRLCAAGFDDVEIHEIKEV